MNVCMYTFMKDNNTNYDENDIEGMDSLISIERYIIIFIYVLINVSIYILCICVYMHT
jgi:hypothetical protein